MVLYMSNAQLRIITPFNPPPNNLLCIRAKIAHTFLKFQRNKKIVSDLFTPFTQAREKKKLFATLALYTRQYLHKNLQLNEKKLHFMGWLKKREDYFTFYKYCEILNIAI